MAKKGGAVQLVVDCENEEDWEKLVERPGLILVDVYSDWCGPCLGMSGNLRKLKLEIGGDTLTLATAKSDNIECLKRFRDRSEPTWMFISHKKTVKLIFGANAPRLINIVTDEVSKEKRGVTREGTDFDQLTNEEQEQADEENRIREEAERIEREEKERLVNERRVEVIENLMEPMKEFNFVMLWPHVTNEGMAKVFDAIKEASMSVAGKPTKVQLKEEDVFEMLYYSSWEYDEMQMEELLKDEVTGLPFQAPMGDTDLDLIDIFLHKIYGPMTMGPPGDDDSIAQRLAIKVKKERKEEEGEAKEERDEEEEEQEEEIPGIYVPENEKCKILAMRILFPQITGKYDLPEPEPIPPRFIIAFDAFKNSEVLQLANDYPNETMNIGFFTSADAETATLIAKTPEQFNKILMKPLDAKLVVQVNKKKSEPLLSYSLLGPVYVSANAVIGEKESALFFPEGYEIIEEEVEVVVEDKKKAKKKAKGSQTDLEDNLDEEELEEELTEEEEEEEKDDDDDFDLFGGYTDDAALLGIPPPAAAPPDSASAAEDGNPPPE